MKTSVLISNITEHDLKMTLHGRQGVTSQHQLRKESNSRIKANGKNQDGSLSNPNYYFVLD